MGVVSAVGVVCLPLCNVTQSPIQKLFDRSYAEPSQYDLLHFLDLVLYARVCGRQCQLYQLLYCLVWRLVIVTIVGYAWICRCMCVCMVCVCVYVCE